MQDWKSLRPKTQVQQALALWAAECAEHVLAIFEASCPEDARPRQAIEATRAWARGELPTAEGSAAAIAAHAAAREAIHPAAKAAARAAGHAFGTAHLVDHAPHAAHYAATAASQAASWEQADTALASERQWQWERLAEELRPYGFPKGL